MGKFVTTIKTRYTNTAVTADKKAFVSKYSSKNTRKVISGESRGIGKRFTSQTIK